MAKANWPRCFSETLKHEGGYVDHPADPGGATNLGITIGTLSAWLGRKATKAEVRALTPDAVRPIYKARYWDKVRGDDLPDGVDLVTYDAGVNSGPSRGAKWTQRAVGVKADGVIGDLETLPALRKAVPSIVVKRATGYRLAFLQGLSTWRVFGKGWGRRVGEVRALGLEMAGAAAASIAADAKKIEASGKSDAKQSTAAGSSGAVAGGGTALDQAQGFDWSSLIPLGLVTLVLVVLAVLLITRAKAKREAAKAMREHAAAMKGA